VLQDQDCTGTIDENCYCEQCIFVLCFICQSRLGLEGLVLVLVQYLAKRLAGKNDSEMTYFVSSGMSNLNSVSVLVLVWRDSWSCSCLGSWHCWSYLQEWFTLMRGSSGLMLYQTADELPALEDDRAHVASADTDEGSVDAAENSDDNEDTDADADDDEFVDAGDEVEDGADHAPWVTERRHSGDGEVRIYHFIQGFCSSLIFTIQQIIVVHNPHMENLVEVFMILITVLFFVIMLECCVYL